MIKSCFQDTTLLRMGTAIACAALLTGGVALAADHADSPSLNTEASAPIAQKQADINDIYAFMNPEAGRSDELILIMTVVPDALPTDTFAADISYNFLIENEAETHYRIQCLFPTATEVNCTLGDLVVSGTVGQDAENGDMRIYTGLRDDPFFFNGMGLSQTFAAIDAGDMGSAALRFQQAADANGGEANNFAGENILALVIGVNRSLLIASDTQGELNIWAATERM